MNNKRLNNAGFTLIELLAVITIMGILMMVAIPAVSRTIENSRRDSFATVAQNYINTVRNSVLADELKCSPSKGTTLDYTTAKGGVNVSAVSSSEEYFFYIDTGIATASKNEYKQQAADLMESGGNSSWGGAPVEGYVKWKKKPVAGGTASDTDNWVYEIVLRDTGDHGISSWSQDQQIKRSSVIVKDVKNLDTAKTSLANSYECVLVK